MTQEQQTITNEELNEGSFDLDEFFRQAEEEKENIIQEEIESGEVESSTPSSGEEVTSTKEKKTSKLKREKVKKVEEPTNSWTTTLSENQVYKVNEFDKQIYEFHPVIYPDGSFSERYYPFCMEIPLLLCR